MLPEPLVTWSCDKFDQYLFRRDVATIETDHEPLKSIFKKEIHKSPKRLQRMWLALQMYNLEVQCKRGTLMHTADALETGESVTECRRVLRGSVNRTILLPFEHPWKNYSSLQNGKVAIAVIRSRIQDV